MTSYDIMVGLDRPQEVLAGYLEPGNATIKGVAQKAAIRPGLYGIPNYTVCWGRRVKNGKPKSVLDSDGKPMEISYDINDNDYRGEIEPLKWGDPKGTQIVCRWVRGVNTIDQQYQDLVLRVEIREQDPAAAIIELAHGHNKFNDTSDKMLQLFLRVHYANVDSIYKSPNSNSQVTYREINEEKIRKSKTRAIDNKFDAISIVNKADEGVERAAKTRNLLTIVYGLEFKGIDPKKGDIDDIFFALKQFADEQPELFMSRINQYKISVSDTLEKADTFELLDLTLDGVISLRDKPNGKAKPVIENVGAKGKNMLTWVMENYLDNHVYLGMETIKKATDKLK